MTKTYRSIKYLEHHVSITLPNGKGKMIPFIGGTKVPQRINGSFSTSNPDIQKALEEHPSYNVAFRCVTKPVTSDDIKDDPAPTPELTRSKVVQVANFQQAKSHLVKEHGVERADIPSKALLEAKADEVGITFEYV